MRMLEDTKRGYPEEYLRNLEDYVRNLFEDHALDVKFSKDVYFAYALLCNLDLDYPEDLKDASDRGFIENSYIGHFESIEDLNLVLDKTQRNQEYAMIYKGHVFIR